MAAFLRRIFKQSVSRDLESTHRKENRLHQRYQLEDFDLITIMWPNGQSARLRDLSYGGFALEQSMDRSFLGEGNMVQGTFHLQGEYCSFKAKKVRESAKVVGLQFIHDADGTLIFLRGFLENLRSGSSMTPIDPAYLHDKLNNRYQIVLRGDGPVDLMIENLQDEFLNFHMTLRTDKVYHEIRCQDQVIITARSQDAEGVASRMINDASPDPLVLKKATQILLGALIQNIPEAAVIKRIFESLLFTYEARS